MRIIHVLLVCGLFLSAGTFVQVGTDLWIEPIQEGVYRVTHSYPWPANSLVVEMANSELLLVDTPYTPRATEELLDWVAAEFGERQITAINTGFHCDNLGGNGALIDHGIPVYGSDRTARLLAERGEASRQQTLKWLEAPEFERYREAHRKLVFVPPTRRFELDKGLRLAFGEESVRVCFPGPSHAPDNVVVYFPARRLLFGGCMVLGAGKLGNIADADLLAWPQSVRNLLQFDAGTVVPGHGDRHEPILIHETIRLLDQHREATGGRD